MNERLPDGTPLYVCETERQFIGLALMCEADEVLAVALDRNDFVDRSLGAVWAAAQEAARKGDPGLLYSVWLLERAGALDQVGGIERLTDLMGKVLTDIPAFYLEPHAEIIRDWSGRRKGVAAAAESAHRAYSGHHPRTVGIAVESIFSE